MLQKRLRPRQSNKSKSYLSNKWNCSSRHANAQLLYDFTGITAMIFSKHNLPAGHYVYLYLREDNTPYYVGKGSGSRAFKKNPKEFHPPSDLSRITIVADNLTEMWAFILERKFIRWYGRKDLGTGILHNKTDGGEGSSGQITSERTKDLFRGDRNAAKRPEVRDLIKKNHALNNPTTRDALIAKMSGDNHFSKQPGYVNTRVGKNHANYDHTLYELVNVVTNEIIHVTKHEFILREGLSKSRSVASILSPNRKKPYRNWKFIKQL